MIRIAIVIACCLVPRTGIAADPGEPSDAKQAEAFALFDEFVWSPHVRVPSHDLAIQILAASSHGQRVAMALLGQDEARSFRLACAVLEAVPSQDGYEAIRAVAKDEHRPMEIRSLAAIEAVSIAGGGLYYPWPNTRLEGKAELVALEEWLDRHPPFVGERLFERVRMYLAEARHELAEAIESGATDPGDLVDSWKKVAFATRDLSLRHHATDRDAFEVLVEHLRGMLELPAANPDIERVLMGLVKRPMHQAYWHACPDPGWLPAVRAATTRDELRDHFATVDFEPDRHSAQPRIWACVEGLRGLGFAVGEGGLPAENLAALHGAVRSTDLRAVFLAGEVLHAMGVVSWPLPPPTDDAPLVVDAWRSVVLGESALHAAETGTAPAWDETQQAWILAPLRE